MLTFHFLKSCKTNFFIIIVIGSIMLFFETVFCVVWDKTSYVEVIGKQWERSMSPKFE